MSTRPARLRRALIGAAGAVLLSPFLCQRSEAGTAFALTGENHLLQFDTASPGTISRTVTVGGLSAGEDLLGIDFRPAEPGVLYGLGNLGTTYKINVGTGAASQIGAPVDPAAAPLAGETYGFDFNPVVDRVRVVSDLGENLRFNQTTGALVMADGALAYKAGDANEGVPPTVSAVAYTNSDNDPATGTALYAIDSALGVLALQDPPNDGVLATVGPLGLSDLPLFGGFDVAGVANDAFAATSYDPPFGALPALNATLYGIDLTSGAATSLGTIGDGSALINGLAINNGTTVIPLPPAVFAFPLVAGLVALYQRRVRRQLQTA